MFRKFAIAAVFALWLLVTAFLFYALLLRRDLFPLAFVVAVLVALLWIVGRLVVSLVHRIRAREFIFPPRFPNALFCEWWISGRGHQRLLFQRPAASNCLWVAVLPDRFRVGAIFPFNLFFLPERLGMEYNIPSEQIISVTEHESRVGRVSVTVRFRSDDGAEVEFDLAVRDAKRFSAAVDQMSKTPADPNRSPVA